MTVERLKPHEVSCKLGKLDSTTTGDDRIVSSLVFNVLVHPDWNNAKDSIDADIAVIVLMDSINFSESIQPICLPTLSTIYDSEIGSVVGWSGSTENPTKIDAKVTESSLCHKESNSFDSTNQTFCGAFNDIETQCLTLSGGGFYGKNQAWNIKGIVSEAQKEIESGCTTSKFQVYTNVASFVGWIQEVMDQTREIVWQEVSFDCSIERERNERQENVFLIKEL